MCFELIEKFLCCDNVLLIYLLLVMILKYWNSVEYLTGEIIQLKHQKVKQC